MITTGDTYFQSFFNLVEFTIVFIHAKKNIPSRDNHSLWSVCEKVYPKIGSIFPYL